MAIGINGNGGRPPEGSRRRRSTQESGGEQERATRQPSSQLRQTGRNPQMQQRPQRPQRPRNDEPVDDLTEDFDDEYAEDDGFGGMKKKIMIVGVIVGVIVIAIVAKIAFSGKKKEVPTTTVTSEVSDDSGDESSGSGAKGGTGVYEDYVQYDDQGNPINAKDTPKPAENKYVEGDSDYDSSTKRDAPAKVFSADDFVKDLEGEDVKAIYSVESSEYIKAHVSYTAKRAIIDDGMEMYWIDVDYKGKKYRAQCPFYYFKDLEESGVCRVEMEVLYLEGGGQVISYMHVIDEAEETEK